jgi:hypothetical protein
MPPLPETHKQKQKELVCFPLPLKLQVVVSPLSSSPDQGHKFKLIGITTSATEIWKIDDIMKRQERWDGNT